MNALEWFRGVIWPRKTQTSDGKTLYKYVVIGIIVSKESIPEFDGNEFLLDGNTFGALADILGSLPQKEPTMKLATANQVLTSLDIIVADEREG